MYKRLLAFGIIFALAGGFIFFYSLTSETVKVSGEVLTQEENRAKVWPVLLESSFMLIGIGITIHSARHVIIDRNTDIYGKEAYGMIADIFDSGTRINHVPQLKATVLIMGESGIVFEMSEYIGENQQRYLSGDFLLVKYSDSDVNILHRVDRSELPPATAEKLEQEYRMYLE